MAYAPPMWGAAGVYLQYYLLLYIFVYTKRLGDGGVWEAINSRPDLQAVSTTMAANFANSIASVIDTGGK
jgi:hypothetical protein